jgi:hypothetical protein
MNLLCNYSKEEMLKVVAEHASKTLPKDKKGILRAIPLDDGGVEVLFINNEDITSVN